MQRFSFQMIMMAQTHASDQRESKFLPHAPFLVHATTTATASKTSLKKWIRAASNSFALSAYSISFNTSNIGKFFWSWILKDCIKVQEKKKKNVVCVPVRDKTWNLALSRCSQVWCMFKANLNLLVFAVLVAVAIVVAQVPYFSSITGG